jgi:hypothetical protein
MTRRLLFLSAVLVVAILGLVAVLNINIRVPTPGERREREERETFKKLKVVPRQE